MTAENGPDQQERGTQISAVRALQTTGHPQTPCAFCGKPFVPLSRGANVRARGYCSRRCYDAGLRRIRPGPRTHRCEVCHAELWARAGTRFCSDACRKVGARRPKPRRCIVCGDALPIASRAGRLFCGDLCRQWERRRHREAAERIRGGPQRRAVY